MNCTGPLNNWIINFTIFVLLFACLLAFFSDEQSSSNLSDTKASQASDDDEDEMVTEAMQFNQLSLEEFCMILLSRVIPMLKGSLCADSSIIESAVHLLHEVLSLMKNVFPDDLWSCVTQLSSLMVSKLEMVKFIIPMAM